MADFLARLVERTVATQPAVRPDIPASQASRQDNIAWAEIAEEGSTTPWNEQHPVPATAVTVTQVRTTESPSQSRIFSPTSHHAEHSEVPASSRPVPLSQQQTRGKDTSVIGKPVSAHTQAKITVPSVSPAVPSLLSTRPTKSTLPEVAESSQPRNVSPAPPASRIERQMRIAQNAPAPVQVSIGRIEVRAVVPPASPPPRLPEKKRATHMSLEDYLNARNRGRR